jgi:hypothetical protein
MKETHSKRRLFVSFDGDSAPYVIVPRVQADKLRKLFDKHAIKFTVNQRGQKSFSVFVLSQDSDVRLVQSVLDSVT